MKKQKVNSVERTYRELWKGLGEKNYARFTQITRNLPHPPKKKA